MADHLASIYGTEKDKVNCVFYFKTGACRHGEKCARKHVKPNYSQTVLLQNFYPNPLAQEGNRMTRKEMQNHFETFYHDIFQEVAKYGEIEEMNVCDNTGDHLLGSMFFLRVDVYIRYKQEADASAAVKDLNNRYYDKKPIYAELSPVTDFRAACCKEFEMDECKREGFCNFMHLKELSPEVRKDLFQAQKASLNILKPDHDKAPPPRRGPDVYRPDEHRGRGSDVYRPDEDRRHR